MMRRAERVKNTIFQFWIGVKRFEPASPNYYDKHLCKYAEFFVGFYNQSPGVTITEDTWVIYVP